MTRAGRKVGSRRQKNLGAGNALRVGRSDPTDTGPNDMYRRHTAPTTSDRSCGEEPMNIATNSQSRSPRSCRRARRIATSALLVVATLGAASGVLAACGGTTKPKVEPRRNTVHRTTSTTRADPPTTTTLIQGFGTSTTTPT